MAGGIIEHDGRLLMVKNLRRQGTVDWSTPGGVVDPGDTSPSAGLTREVAEETGLAVGGWEGPLYEVVTHAPAWGWTMRCFVFRATSWSGEIVVDDPDGIVVEAVFVEPARHAELLGGCFPWVAEPLSAWLDERWTVDARRTFRFEVAGESMTSLRVTARG